MILFIQLVRNPDNTIVLRSMTLTPVRAITAILTFIYLFLRYIVIVGCVFTVVFEIQSLSVGTNVFVLFAVVLHVLGTVNVIAVFSCFCHFVFLWFDVGILTVSFKIVEVFLTRISGIGNKVFYLPMYSFNVI